MVRDTAALVSSPQRHKATGWAPLAALAMIRRHEQPTADSPILPTRHLHLSAGRAAGSTGRRRAHPAAHPPRGKPPLLERLANVQSLEELGGCSSACSNSWAFMTIAPGHNEVRSMRGIAIEFAEQPGLCRKTRPPLPPPFAAVWRSARNRRRLLDAHDLLGGL